MSRRGWLLFAAMSVVWGIPYLLIKVAVGSITPATLVFQRTVLGALILVPIALARRDARAVLSHWRIILIYTAVEIALPWFLLSEAELRLSSSLTGLLIATVPLIGAVLAHVTGAADRLRAREIAGLLIGICGVASVVGLDFSGSDLGAFAEMLVVTVCYAVGPMIIARRLRGVPTLGVVAASLTLTAIAYAPAGIVQLPHVALPGQVIASVVALGVMCTALAFLLFFALIAEAGPVRATIITYVNPAIALLLGVTLLHERFTLGAGLGFALIIAGSFLATRRRAGSTHRPVASSVLDGRIAS